MQQGWWLSVHGQVSSLSVLIIQIPAFAYQDDDVDSDDATIKKNAADDEVGFVPLSNCPVAVVLCVAAECMLCGVASVLVCAVQNGCCAEFVCAESVCHGRQTMNRLTYWLL